jgi:two-component system, OmpR family, sensor histidine kinase BaeS
MKRIFPWLLHRFFLAFAILIFIQLAVNTAGIGILLSRYSKMQEEGLRKMALEVLINPGRYDSGSLPYSSSFFVYSADKNMVFSNRGKGRSISEKELRPVEYQGAVIGYFYAGEIHFADNRANRVFLVSLLLLGGFSIVFSAGIGLFFSLSSSKKIAEPMKALRGDIRDIRLTNTVPERAFTIAELKDISTDLADVSITLYNQKKYKQEWMRDLAHDLRTPLSGLRSQLEAMIDGVLETTPERLKRNLMEISRLDELVLSMNELAAIESKQSIEKQLIEPEALVTRLLMPFEVAIKEKSITVTTRTAPEKIRGDEQLLLRGIGNILANAVQYSEEKSTIWISVSSPVIEIANNGPDILEGQKERIFNRLYRGESARSTPGSGLGLSITKEIVNLHGGSIRVESLEPRGVRFIVSLPPF